VTFLGTKFGFPSLIQQLETQLGYGVVMREPTRINGNGEQRQRISDELRQLKQMSKGLRTKAMRAMMERHAAKRGETNTLLAKPIVTAPLLSTPLIGKPLVGKALVSKPITKPVVLPAKASVAA
jgi:hypothetical protein